MIQIPRVHREGSFQQQCMLLCARDILNSHATTVKTLKSLPRSLLLDTQHFYIKFTQAQLMGHGSLRNLSNTASAAFTETSSDRQGSCIRERGAQEGLLQLNKVTALRALNMKSFIMTIL